MSGPRLSKASMPELLDTYKLTDTCQVCGFRINAPVARDVPISVALAALDALHNVVSPKCEARR